MTAVSVLRPHRPITAPPSSAPVVTPTVAVVGAGASGTLCAAQLARAAARSGRRVDILLIDPAAPGRGVAYSTPDPRHRLNVPASNMSAFPDVPDHFVGWLREHVDPDTPGSAFVPRGTYGDYLEHVLAKAVAVSDRVSLDHVPVRATDVRPHGRRLRVSLADGTSRAADAVVLATGYGESGISWAPAALRNSPNFVPDPWRTDGEPAVGEGGEIVLVGAGLTAVDMAMRWARPGVRVHIVSRSGMLPLAHADQPAPPAPPPAVGADVDLAGARRLVFETIRNADGDWRRAIDAMRPVTARLWGSLDDSQRRLFVAGAARRWERVRHRVAPEVHARLRQMCERGEVLVHAGGLVGASRSGLRTRVELGDGAVVDADLVINCTGASTDVRSSSDALVMNLLAAGRARPGPLDLGFAVDRSGRLRPQTGEPAKIWTLGPLRRGELWETTAIPEIRVQAQQVADAIVATLPDPQLRRRPRDPFGLPLSASPATAGLFNAALARILKVQSGAERLLAHAVEEEPEFALAHAVRAVLGAEWGADVDVATSLAAAEASASRADERERRFIEVVARRVRRPGPDSAAALLAYIDAYPEDALAVSLAVPTIAFSGATEVPAEAWSLVDALAPAYGDHWWYLGMAAFTAQERERYDEAGELARRALSVQPAAGHAVHAKAHVHYETGDHRAGLVWLDRWLERCGPQASHGAHFSWHAALHELSLGDFEAMSARYATQLAPPAVTGVRALVDSASLLWRARTIGIPPSARGVADVLRTVPEELLTEPPTPFVALHAAVALAAADDCRALAGLRRYAAASDSEVLARTVAPLADALVDVVHGDFAEAAGALAALDGVHRLGGSAAQREVVEDTLLFCAVQAGRYELAHGILTERLERRPSPQDRRRRMAVEAQAAVSPLGSPQWAVRR